jgi:hypothetical protein
VREELLLPIASIKAVKMIITANLIVVAAVKITVADILSA